MTDAAQPTVDDALSESPELEERIHRAGFRILASATIMFFLGFVFAYFYLRSLNNAHLWRPDGVDPPQGYGAVIAAAFVLSAASFAYAARLARAGRSWVVPAGSSLVLGLAGCVVQAFEYAHIPFGPQSGGYASVFICWTALYVVCVLLTMYRVETIFAAGVRNRRQEGGYEPIGFGSGSYYWTLLAGIGVLAYVILYLV